MSVQALVTIGVIYGGMFLILVVCFVYAFMKRSAIVKLQQKKSKEVDKIIEGSKDPT